MVPHYKNKIVTLANYLVILQLRDCPSYANSKNVVLVKHLWETSKNYSNISSFFQPCIHQIFGKSRQVKPRRAGAWKDYSLQRVALTHTKVLMVLKLNTLSE